MSSSGTPPRGRRADQKGALTTADLVVLSLLRERPMHGYDLLAEYDRQEVADWASISKAQLYYSLRKLDGLALIAADLEEGAVRDRVVFRPTETGAQALAAALAEPLWAKGRVAQPFTTWFGLSMHASKSAQAVMLHARLVWLHEEIAKEGESLAFIRTLKGGRARKGEAIVRLVIAQLEVEHAWLTELLAQG